jgi:hypothetical protein
VRDPPSVCRISTTAEVGDHVTIKPSSPPECVHKSKLTQLVPILAIDGNYVCGCYTLCSVNERVARNERHAVPFPMIDDDRLKELGTFVRKHRKVRQLEPLTWDELISDVPKNRKRRVELARDTFYREGWSNRYTKVKAFIKFEKWEAYGILSEMDKPMSVKAPRLIQYRDPVYTYMIALFERAIEHYVFNTDYNGKYVPTHKKEFAKSMTSWEIANNLYRKSLKFRKPKFTMLDYSRMDATLRRLLREVAEWSVYRRCIRDPFFWWLLEQQIKNNVSTRNGNFWTIIGTMMSGEYNTSLGDSEINRNMLKKLMEFIMHEMLVCGDDGVVITEDSVDTNFDFAQYGMIAKISTTTEFTQVDFCQCRPIRVCGQWRMVRNPYRVMSRSAYTTKTLVGKGWVKLLGSIGICELSCNTGVPILQSYANMLYRSANRITDQLMISEYMAQRRDKITDKLLPVTDEARIDFWMAYDISPSQQREMEQLFDDVELPCLPCS